jgi:hypothetical protein
MTILRSMENTLAKKKDEVPNYNFINKMLRTTNIIEGTTDTYLYFLIDYPPFANRKAYIIPFIPNTDSKTVYTCIASIPSKLTHFSPYKNVRKA